MAELGSISERLAVSAIPLIWTADFILDYDEDKNDTFKLSELNCSCVGFTTNLSTSDTVADSIIALVTAARA